MIHLHPQWPLMATDSYIKQTQGYNFRPVLGHLGSSRMRNWSNLGKFGHNSLKIWLKSPKSQFKAPQMISLHPQWPLMATQLKHTQEYNFRPVLGHLGSSRKRNLGKFGQKLLKIWPKSQNRPLCNSSDLFASPMAIVGYRSLKQSQLGVTGVTQG